MSASLTTPEIASSLIPHITDDFDSKGEVVMNGERVRLLIEDWLPIAEIGIESLRERTPMTPFPAPNRLHVWWARRPLVASRAAVLACLLPSYQDLEVKTRLQQVVKWVLGIHGDPLAARTRIAEATRQEVRLGKSAYGYDRAFKYTPTEEEIEWIKKHADKARYGERIVVADLMAGGGSIPFEILRLGVDAIANDLNPVAWLVLKATVELPNKFDDSLVKRFLEIGGELVQRVRSRLAHLFPSEPEPDCIPDGYLWARTIHCPYCGGIIPLSPNWRLNTIPFVLAQVTAI